MKYVIAFLTLVAANCGTPMTAEDRRAQQLQQKQWLVGMSDEALLSAFYNLESQIAAESRMAASYHNSANSSQTSLGAGLADTMFGSFSERKVAGMRQQQLQYRLELRRRGIQP